MINHCHGDVVSASQRILYEHVDYERKTIMNRHLFSLGCAASIVLGICQLAAAETETFFPLGRSLVEDKENLPFPCGFGVNYYYQRQGYDMSRITLTPDVSRMFPLNPSELGVKSRINEVNLKLDVWLLPFLNVFGIAGRVDEKTTVSNIPHPQLRTLQYEDSGNLYGGGATLVYAIKHFWASLTVADSYADLNKSDSWIQAFVLTPKVGARVNTPWPGKGLNVWVGGTFQKAEEEHTGNWDIPGLGPLKYDVKLKESEPLNVVAGLGTDLWGRLALEVELGFGEREQVLTSLAYRF